MADGPETRIGAARERATAAKVLLGGAAVGAFGLVLALARVSHPAAAQQPSAATTTAPTVVQQQGDDYGGGSISPYDDSFDGPSAGAGSS